MGLEKLTWYNSLVAVASGKDCVMMEGVRQLLLLSTVDILVVSPRLALCNFLISASTPNQFMCSLASTCCSVVCGGFSLQSEGCRIDSLGFTFFWVEVNLPN